ncbi:hypothetical protein O181_060453 [Austropuccinia psidii MF-1]|uniref:CCHC-type domain-containing protein n=1 Tax=Austropuccinia psidii MF-1 TaxID=1389203 RepID=A0A9Q3EKT5_9BASI|nr:hypothetical protein [Austropuccinia psidii MF-1]
MQLLSPPPPGASLQLHPHVNMLAYECFMQEPYCAANRFPKHQGDGSNFAEWISSLNHVLCIAFNSKALIDDSPSLLEGQSPQENQAISHFIDVLIPHNFTLCIGIIPLRATAKEFFDAIKACCCPGSCFHKLRVVGELLQILTDNASDNSKTNTIIVLLLQYTFAMLKKLGIKANELEVLLAQATCHAPSTLDQAAFDQLITMAILSKGDEKPTLTFVGQVIINASQRSEEWAREVSPFIYCVPDLPKPSTSYTRAHPLRLSSKVCCPPSHLVDRFGTSCFHCGRASHWRADCPHTTGVANPNPRLVSPTPFCQMSPPTPD